MKKQKKKKRDDWVKKFCKKFAKKLIINPDETKFSYNEVVDQFFIFNEKTGYYEPIKKVLNS